jgi:hypothetical protein
MNLMMIQLMSSSVPEAKVTALVPTVRCGIEQSRAGAVAAIIHVPAPARCASWPFGTSGRRDYTDVTFNLSHHVMWSIHDTGGATESPTSLSEGPSLSQVLLQLEVRPFDPHSTESDRPDGAGGSGV